MEQFVEIFNNFITTTAGKVTISLIGVILLVIGVGVASSKKKFNTKILVYSAMALALGTVFSMIKVWEMPMGGSVTLFSMLFIVLIGYWFGPVQGILCGLTFGLLQLIIEPYVVHPVQLILDYFLAFSMLGLSGFMKDKKNGLIYGYLLAVFGRFIFSFISGYVFFGEYASYYNYNSEVLYSFVYNISYMGTEAILTSIVIAIPSVKKAFDVVKSNIAL